MTDALATALVHFVWQGAVLAWVSWGLMRLATAPSVRYVIGVTTLVAMLAAPVVSFLAAKSAGSSGVGALAAIAVQSGVATHASDDGAALSEAAHSTSGFGVPNTWVVSLWLLGVCILSLRFAGGLAMAHRVAAGAVVPVGDDLQRLAASLASRLNMRGGVRVCQSASIAVPVMVGWLRPVVVLPPAALAILPLAQVEAVLAHEFAHIRRHDYLVNLLQTVVETVCFYHPAVWWVSHRVRLEREHCCDDVAVTVCDRLTYVTALSALASLSAPSLALAATGGSLRDRVRRLVAPSTLSTTAKGGWMAIFPMLLVLSFAGQVSTPRPVVVEPAQPLIREIRVATPTTDSVKVATVRPTVTPVTLAAVRVAPRKIAVKVVPQREQVRRRELEPAEAELVLLESRLRQDSVKLERQLELLQRGLVTQQSVDEVKERIAALIHRLESAKEHAAQLEREPLEQRRVEAGARERMQELVERGLVTEKLRNEALAEMADVSKRVASIQRERALSAEIEMVEQQAELQRRLVRERTAPGRLAVLSTPEPDSPVQPQDRLTIVIAGEPDLPTRFTVREDGSIRFPFLGVIRVAGSSASQVQSVIQKLIVDKGLGRNPVVTVTLGRGR